jgi:hypothetical protein
MSGIDDIAVSAIGLGGNNGRLDDADGLDCRQHQRVGLRRRLRLTHPVRVFSFSARGSTFMICMGLNPFGSSGPAPCQPFLSLFVHPSRFSFQSSLINLSRSSQPRECCLHP